MNTDYEIGHEYGLTGVEPAYAPTDPIWQSKEFRRGERDAQEKKRTMGLPRETGHGSVRVEKVESYGS